MKRFSFFLFSQVALSQLISLKACTPDMVHTELFPKEIDTDQDIQVVARDGASRVQSRKPLPTFSCKSLPSISKIRMELIVEYWNALSCSLEDTMYYPYTYGNYILYFEPKD